MPSDALPVECEPPPALDMSVTCCRLARLLPPPRTAAGRADLAYCRECEISCRPVLPSVKRSFKSRWQETDEKKMLVWLWRRHRSAGLLARRRREFCSGRWAELRRKVEPGSVEYLQKERKGRSWAEIKYTQATAEEIPRPALRRRWGVAWAAEAQVCVGSGRRCVVQRGDGKEAERTMTGWPGALCNLRTARCVPLHCPRSH